MFGLICLLLESYHYYKSHDWHCKLLIVFKVIITFELIFDISTCKLTLHLPKCKEEITKKHFCPSTIRSWNSLNPQCHEASSKSQFSTLINNMYDSKKRLILYCVSRSTQIAFSQLNYDLYINNWVETENCECGHIMEDSNHYLLQCPNYTSQRNMLDKVKTITKTKYIAPQHLLNGYKKTECQ